MILKYVNIRLFKETCLTVANFSDFWVVVGCCFWCICLSQSGQPKVHLNPLPFPLDLNATQVSIAIFSILHSSIRAAMLSRCAPGMSAMYVCDIGDELFASALVGRDENESRVGFLWHVFIGVGLAIRIGICIRIRIRIRECFPFSSFNHAPCDTNIGCYTRVPTT